MNKWPSTAGGSPQRDLLLSITSAFLLILAVFRGGLDGGGDLIAQILGGTAAALVGVPIIARAVHALFNPDWDGVTDQLVAIALLGAWAVGDLVTAALVPLAMLLGHVVEERSLAGTREAIEALARMTRVSARRLRADCSEEEVPGDELTGGDRIVIRPGEAIAADGTVLEGQGHLDTSALTGESLPREVSGGAEVLAGSMTVDGQLVVQVTQAGGATALGRVVDLLHQAEQAKPPISRLLDRYMARYLPVVLLGALGVLFLTGRMDTALAVLIAACPCALALAAPATAVAGVAAASRLGVLVKGSAFLERLGEADTVVFDKTGTLTQGRLAVCEVRPEPGCDADDLRNAAAALAKGSVHPVARGLSQWNSAAEANDIVEHQGRGLTGQVTGRPVAVGRAEWLAESFTLPAIPVVEASLVGVVVDGAFMGWIMLADESRPEAPEAIDELRSLGIDRHLMVTGDRKPVAAAIGSRLGIDQVVAEVLPEGKWERVQAEQASGRSVVVVGDGINDSLALKAGHVGVAIGGERRTDLALAAADLVLLSEDLRRLPATIDLARRCRRTVNVNVVLALAWTGLMIAFAAGGAIGPLATTLLHNVGTILVIANASRLLRQRDDHGRQQSLQELLAPYQVAEN